MNRGAKSLKEKASHEKRSVARKKNQENKNQQPSNRGIIEMQAKIGGAKM